MEYAQCLRYYWPHLLQETCQVHRYALLLKTQPSSAQLVADLLDLPLLVEFRVAKTGSAARHFNVSRGWLPDHSLDQIMGYDVLGARCFRDACGDLKRIHGLSRDPGTVDCFGSGRRTRSGTLADLDIDNAREQDEG